MPHGNNKIDAGKEHRIEKVIDLLFSDEVIPEDQLEYIRQWLAGEDNQELKNDALEKKFIDICDCEEKPNYAQEMWPGIASRIRAGGNSSILKQPLPLDEYERGETCRKPLGRRITFRVAVAIIPVVMVLGVVSVLVTRNNSNINPPLAGHTVEFVPEAVTGVVPKTVRELLPETIAGTLRKTTTVSAGDAIRRIDLPDGSEIMLSPGAVLTYNSDFAADRNVRLDGVASFKVAKDSLHPFTVESSAITVTVLGTEFSMRASDDDSIAEVTLTSGSVSVRVDAVNETTVMSPGQRYVYDRAHRTIELHEIGGEEEFMRLRGMSGDFEGTLDELFRAIARNSGKILKVESGIDVERYLVMPYERTEPVAETLELVWMMTGGMFDYTIKQDTIIITQVKQ